MDARLPGLYMAIPQRVQQDSSLQIPEQSVIAIQMLLSIVEKLPMQKVPGLALLTQIRLIIVILQEKSSAGIIPYRLGLSTKLQMIGTGMLIIVILQYLT